MNPCIRFAPMIGSRPGELPEADERALQDHLSTCDACRGRLADADVIGRLLGEALMAEANGRDFSTFADRVLARTEPGGLLGWIRRHRRAALATLVAPALAAASLVLYVAIGSRPDPEQALVEVNTGTGATILQTSEGPIVLIGASGSEGT